MPHCRFHLPLRLALVALSALTGCRDAVAPEEAGQPLAASNAPPPPKPIGPVIAFQRSYWNGNSDIFRIAASGLWLKQLTSGPAADSLPAFSPNGKKLAWVRVTASESQIWVMNPDASGQTNLSNGINRDRLPIWSPDGSKILFERLVKKMWLSNWEIFVMNADGSNQVNLSQGFAAMDWQPQWSPTGAQVVFASDRGGNFEVYRVSVDGTGLVNLTQNPHDDYAPNWSPDGQTISFYRMDPVSGPVGIFTMQPDGSAQAKLTAPMFYHRWSPSGSRLAAVTEDGELTVFDADGSDLAVVAASTADIGGVAWSPNGGAIAYWSYSNRLGTRGIRVVGANDGAEQFLTNHPSDTFVNDRWPTWAP